MMITVRDGSMDPDAQILDTSLRALIVDNDNIALQLLAAILQDNGIHCQTATTPAQALACLAQFQPDIVLLASSWSRTVGDQLVADIRKAGVVPEAAILLLTADQSPAELAALINNGVDFLLARPGPQDASLFAQLVRSQAARCRRLRDHRLMWAVAERSNQFLRLAIDAHAIVSTADASGNILFVNQKFVDISGYERHELMGHNHRILKSGIHPEAFYVELWSVIAAGHVWHGEICNHRRDGTPYWVQATIVPMRDADGLPERYVSIRTDITARKDAEVALNVRTLQAESASRAKSEFLSSMSHELRTPLNAILGFAQLLESDDRLQKGDGAAMHEAVVEIRKGGQQLLSLVNDVLDLAKIESGQMVVAIESVSLTEIASSCRLAMGAMARACSIDLSFEQDSCVGLNVLADATRLRQVLLNFISNAIKYNREGGSVRVWCQRTAADGVRIHVTDTGPGIAQEMRVRLFTSFERLGAEMGPVEGTGIGLVISKRLAELMGGAIGVESAPGQGSSFWVELPRVAGVTASSESPAHADATVDAAMVEQTVAGVQKRVLYIEDNQANLGLMRKVFAKRARIVLYDADSAEVGLSLAARLKPDLILLDINLPGIDGYQAIAQLRKMDGLQHTPVVAVSANVMKGDAERGLQAGFNAYVAKPLEVKQFLDQIDRLLEMGDA